MNINQMKRFAPAYTRNFADRGQAMCFIAVYHEHEGDAGPGLGMAVEGERGFYPVPKYIYATEQHSEAQAEADRLNENVLNLSEQRSV